jgi:hypothetical protein
LDSGEGTFAPLERPGVLLRTVNKDGGLGVHTMLHALRLFPGHFENVVFVSVGVIDSGRFKGAESIVQLMAQTREMLERTARTMGLGAAHYSTVGTDVVEEAEKLCMEVSKLYPRATFVAGHLLFERETWVHRLLHNQTAYALQRRLQWAGLNMVVLPARVG